ncbi:16809_t:CDS:1, partial [Racocetra persica]
QISESRIDILTFKDLLEEITVYKKRKVLLLFATVAFHNILRSVGTVPLMWTSLGRCLEENIMFC